MSQLQKIILSITLAFVAVNVILVPLLGIKLANVANYFPYVITYLVLVASFILAAVFIFRKK